MDAQLVRNVRTCGNVQDDKVASNRVLCIIILAIWSWSLLQFTMVLTAGPTKNKKSKVRVKDKKSNCCHTAKNVCCSVDVWSILINIILQDAPFFIFRLLLILHYKIISETNIFFTCKVNPSSFFRQSFQSIECMQKLIKHKKHLRT